MQFNIYYVLHALYEYSEQYVAAGIAVSAGEDSGLVSVWRRAVWVLIADVSKDHDVFIVFLQHLIFEYEDTLFCTV